VPTTTIRIDDDLEERVGAAAERLGKTPHAFMIEAIARTVEQVEEEAAFQDVAERRWSTLLRTGEAVAHDDMARWVRARVRGERVVRPKARRILR
jgi:predicted transcriptional regulator